MQQIRVLNHNRQSVNILETDLLHNVTHHKCPHNKLNEKNE